MNSNFRRASGRFGGVAARTILGFSLLTGYVTTAWAQENSGLITGTVMDATGAGVPGAAVTATTAVLPKGIQVQSDSFGKYLLPQLPIGVYTVTVTKQGFSKLVQRNINVRLGSQIDFNPKLAVGAVAEVVEVSDSAVTATIRAFTSRINGAFTSESL